MKKSILIIEDSDVQLEWYKEIVGGYFHYFTAKTAEDASFLMNQNAIDIVLTDIHLSPADGPGRFEGFHIIKQVKSNHPEVLIIATSADPDISTYMQAMALGAENWLKKPFLVIEELLTAIEGAENSRLLKRMKTGSPPFKKRMELCCEDGLVLDNQTRKYIKGIAKMRTISSVIYGETGTGKEEVAKLIHKRRVEMEGAIPFIAVNCANINTTMAASILFGHKRGAFTGAEKTTNGLIGEADGGILFLDELHRLDEDCQSRLLRVLNDGTYQRLGDTKTLSSSFQVIAASSLNLDEAVMKGDFLMDLRSRLTGIDIHLKPLRERKGDMDLLVALFFAKENINITKSELTEITRRCKRYYWQGNIRQLFNVLKSLYTLCMLNDEPLNISRMPEYKTMFAPGDSPRDFDRLTKFNWERPLKESLESLEKEILQRALVKYSNKSELVGILKMNRSTFAARLEKYGLN